MMKIPDRVANTTLTWAAVLTLTSAALAVKTEYFTQTTPDDFKAGTATSVVVTNHGDLRLSRELKSLLPNDKSITAIPAMASAGDGTVVFATFPENEVLRLKDGKLETLAKFENETITALHCNDGQVWVALAGDDKATVMKIAKAGDKPELECELPDAQYIWKLFWGEKHMRTLYMATGTPARVYAFTAGKLSVVATLDGENVLSLIEDKNHVLYAGTDTDGLVYKIGDAAKPALLFDAAESEISSLAFDDAGQLLVATGEAKEHVPQALVAAATGRPEHGGGESTIPSKTPATPAPPEDRAAPADAIPHDAPEPPAATDNAATLPAGDAEGTDAGPAQPIPGAEAQPTSGNALYRIDQRGLVTELFRSGVVIYDIATQGKTIFLATGESGEVHAIDPSAEESTVIARTDSAQVSQIVTAPDGTIYLATSNAGSVQSLGAGVAAEGSFESSVLDAGVASDFGKLQLRGQLPEGSSLTVATRSGNAADPESGTWSDWSEPAAAQEFVDVKAARARYIQYKLVFKTAPGKPAPSLDEIRIAYQKPNVAPRLSSLTITKDETGNGNHTITWEATDPNADTLKHAVYARAVGRGGWVELAKDLTANTHTWPAKQTADGRYEIKVVASDATDNQPGEGQQASRVSETIIVDNTAPVIGDVKVDKTTVTLRVVDRNGALASLDYAVDSAEHWQRRLPDDTMADSPEERYTLSLGKLASGQHTLTVRATDSEGNTAFETIGVSVP